MGHSAGGQLALWLAARSRIDPRSELYVRDALPVRGVVALAPATELRELHARRVFDDVVDRLVGGSPAAFPERYAAVSPGDLVPTQVPQVVIIGKHDDFWGWNALAYVAAARNAGEPHVAFEIIESAGHFEVIDPRTDAWRSVLAAARRLV